MFTLLAKDEVVHSGLCVEVLDNTIFRSLVIPYFSFNTLGELKMSKTI